MSERELVQKILSWIERTEQENTQEDISYESVMSRLAVLVNDIEKLCKESLSEAVVSGHFPIMCTGVGPELIHIPANSSIQLPDMDVLWKIAQVVAEKSPLHEYAGRYYCNYCDERQSDIHLDEIISSMNIEEDYDNGMATFVRQFPHDPECIVTKARTLMEWRKAQPRIEVSIKKSDELAEDTLREMVRQMVSEALAKPPEPQPIEDAIVNHTCEACGENYVGLISNMKGWYGIVDQGTWETPTPRKEYAFCSEEHMDQWKAEVAERKIRRYGPPRF